MGNQIMYQTMFELAERSDIPQEAYSQAYELARKAGAQDFRRAKAYQAGLAKLQKSYLEQLHTIIGERHLRRYLTLHARRMKRVKAAQRAFRPSLQGFREQAALYAEVSERSTKAIKASGVDVRRVQPLAKATHEKAWRLFENTRERALPPEASAADPTRSIVRHSTAGEGFALPPDPTSPISRPTKPT